MDIKTSSVDDLALLAAFIKNSGLLKQIDQFYPTHGSWKGPSVGTITLGWLLYILSESDHRLSVVEEWAAARLPVLQWLLESPNFEAKHLSDDRLELLLEYFSRDKTWWDFEKAHNQDLVQVYDLSGKIVRLDACIAKSFRDVGKLFQFGHSKQHRSDLPQVKTMLATLDPLSTPLACYTVAGHRADDQLYIPIVERVREQLSDSGLLYVGDAKLGSLGNRSYLARSQNQYLCPLSKTQFPQALLHQVVDQLEAKPSERQAIFVQRDGEQIQIAWAYELSAELMEDKKHPYQWSERRILVHSFSLGKSRTDSLMRKLMETQQVIQERFVPRKGRSILRELNKAQTFVDKQLKRFNVDGVIQVHLTQGPPSPKIQKPAPIQCEINIDLATVKQEAKLFGWRVYATNTSIHDLPAQKLVLCYRQQYRIEHQFNHLLNRTTALLPIYLNLEHRIKALIRLLFLALKYVTIIQHKVRTKMAQTKQSLKKMIPGNPGRKVDSPTTGLLLRAFKNIFLNIVFFNDGSPPLYQINSLNETQKQILDLLDLSHSIYVHHFQRT